MKEEQKKHLIDMMQEDEESGLYDVFNDEKRQGVKELIDAHKQGRDKIENDFLKCLSDSKVVYEPKQETLEEAKYNAYKEYWNENHTQEVKSNFLTAFELGAKWQQEQDKDVYLNGYVDGSRAQAKLMYSEEDMAESFMACWKANVPAGFECKLSFNEWFEQFKKKQDETTM